MRFSVQHLRVSKAKAKASIINLSVNQYNFEFRFCCCSIKDDKGIFCQIMVRSFIDLHRQTVNAGCWLVGVIIVAACFYAESCRMGL